MFKKALVLTFAVVWLVTAINPSDVGIWALENALVVLFFPVVLWLDRCYRFNNLTFLSLTAFVILHLFAAHTTYSQMVHFQWFSELFGWERNYYDQLVHFLFGLMIFVPFYEVFYHQGQTRRLSYLLAFLLICSVATWYEILEWLAMITFCEKPQQICFDALTQGDIWDTQRDTALAVVGALIALALHALWGERRPGR